MTAVYEALAKAAVGDRPIGFAKHNGAGEILFRQAGHPANDEALLTERWIPIWLRPDLEHPLIAGLRLIADIIHWHGITHDALASAFFADLSDEQQRRRLAQSSWNRKPPGPLRSQHHGRVTVGGTKKKGKRR